MRLCVKVTVSILAMFPGLASPNLASLFIMDTGILAWEQGYLHAARGINSSRQN